MQLVRRDKGLERNMLDFVPVAHDREAVEQIDIRLLGDERNLIFHALRLGLGQHPRRKLHIDQYNIGARRGKLRDAFVEHDGVRLERMVAQHGIGPDLPEHQIGMRRKHAGLEPLDHLRGFFAVDAAIEHGDIGTRETLFQFGGETARIACRR